MSDGIKRWLLAVAGTVVAAALIAGGAWVWHLDGRLAALEAQQGLPARVTALERDLAEHKAKYKERRRADEHDAAQVEERLRWLERHDNARRRTVATPQDDDETDR